MDENDKLPRFSYDLIHALAATTPKVVLPSSARGAVNFTEGLAGFMWDAARRSLVDELLQALAEEESGDAGTTDAEGEDEVAPSSDYEADWAVGRFPKVFDASGEVRVLEPPRRRTVD
jgi:hypothetical protein